MKKKNYRYKGWLCLWDDEYERYEIYRKEGFVFRYTGIVCSTIERVKEFIDAYK
jgi:hypothetical protein